MFLTDWYRERWYSVVKGSGAKAGSSVSEASARWSSPVRMPSSRAVSRCPPKRSLTSGGGSCPVSSSTDPETCGDSAIQMRLGALEVLGDLIERVLPGVSLVGDERLQDAERERLARACAGTRASRPWRACG